MLERLWGLLFSARVPYSPDREKSLQLRKKGAVLVALFVLSITIYKTVYPHQYLFLFAWITSVVGIPLFFISVIDLLYMKKGWELSEGRVDAYSLSKFINLFSSALFLMAGICLPIIVKIYF